MRTAVPVGPQQFQHSVCAAERYVEEDETAGIRYALELQPTLDQSPQQSSSLLSNWERAGWCTLFHEILDKDYRNSATVHLEDGAGALHTEGKFRLEVRTQAQEVASDELYRRAYLEYLCRSHPFRTIGETEMSGAAGQKRVPESYLKDEFWPIAPRSHQTAIANFLDRETARIDALIAKKEHLLKLLEEKRTALISYAVTKGLDPKAELKNSGVDWLGNIPKDWDVVKLGYLCRIGTGSKDTQDAEDDGEYPFYVRSQTPEKISSYGYDCEAILTAGDGVGVGKVFHYVAGKFDAHQRVYVLRSFRRIKGQLLFYFFREYFKQAALTGDAKSTVDSVRRHMLTMLPIIVPKASEQSGIINHIETASVRFNTLKVKIIHAIELLREKRTALISAAVTGKIEVKGNRL